MSVRVPVVIFRRGEQRARPTAALEAFLPESGVEPVAPRQYMDQWRLDASRIGPRANQAVQQALGFADGAPYRRRRDGRYYLDASGGFGVATSDVGLAPAFGTNFWVRPRMLSAP